MGLNHWLQLADCLLQRSKGFGCWLTVMLQWRATISGFLRPLFFSPPLSFGQFWHLKYILFFERLLSVWEQVSGSSWKFPCSWSSLPKRKKLLERNFGVGMLGVVGDWMDVEGQESRRGYGSLWPGKKDLEEFILRTEDCGEHKGVAWNCAVWSQKGKHLWEAGGEDGWRQEQKTGAWMKGTWYYL